MQTQHLHSMLLEHKVNSVFYKLQNSTTHWKTTAIENICDIFLNIFLNLQELEKTALSLKHCLYT